MSLGISSRKIVSIVFLLATIVISLALSGIPFLVSHAPATRSKFHEGMATATPAPTPALDQVAQIPNTTSTQGDSQSCHPPRPSAQAIVSQQNARSLQYVFDIHANEQFGLA